jgi:hypothetical protein
MCVVSMIMDHYRDRWEPRIPRTDDPFYYPPAPVPLRPQQQWDPKDLQQFMAPKPPAITPEEIAEFRKLLDRAREYDKRNNEPECELAEKRDAVLAIAKALGVEISFL